MALGLCVRLGVFTVPLARSTLSDLAAIIRRSWAADMLTILVDDYGSLEGYVLFAELTQEQEHGLLKGRRLELCATAGEQQGSLWALSAQAASMPARLVGGWVRADWAEGAGKVRYLRPRNGKIVFRETYLARGDRPRFSGWDLEPAHRLLVAARRQAESLCQYGDVVSAAASSDAGSGSQAAFRSRIGNATRMKQCEVFRGADGRQVAVSYGWMARGWDQTAWDSAMVANPATWREGEDLVVLDVMSGAPSSRDDIADMLGSRLGVESVSFHPGLVERMEARQGA